VAKSLHRQPKGRISQEDKTEAEAFKPRAPCPDHGPRRSTGAAAAFGMLQHEIKMLGELLENVDDVSEDDGRTS